MRITPCESTPRRLAHTTASAQRVAMSGATPAPVKIAAAKLVRFDLVRRMSSVMATRTYMRSEEVTTDHGQSRPDPPAASSAGKNFFGKIQAIYNGRRAPITMQGLAQTCENPPAQEQ